MFQRNEKLGAIFTDISKIREEIDTMYIDRGIFVKKWKKLLKEADDIQNEKTILTKLSLAAYDERYSKN